MTAAVNNLSSAERVYGSLSQWCLQSGQ